jgi:chloramphenicol-sensitive protein RarD
MDKSSFGRGIFFALSAYIMWGSSPIYWKSISAINPFHLFCFRLLFSLVLVGSILFAQRNIAWLAVFKDRRKALLMILETFAISFNMGLFVWAISNGYTIQTSLGNYIAPLISVVLGLCFFKEKLNRLQWFAFALAITGVLILTVFTGSLPWISLGLAFSFALFSLLKKNVSLSALESLGAEMLVISPVCLALLFIPFGTTQDSAFSGVQGLFYILKLPLPILILFLLCGVVTIMPMYMFSRGAKMLSLSTLGFVKYINPTLTFLTGVFIFREPFPLRNLIAFGFIWAATVLYIISLKITPKQ